MFSSLEEKETCNGNDTINLDKNNNKGGKRQQKHIAFNKESDGNTVALESIKTISSSPRLTKTTDTGDGKLEVGNYLF